MAHRVVQGFDVQRKADPTKSRRLEPGDVFEDDDLEIGQHLEWMVADGMVVPVDDEPVETEAELEARLSKTDLQELARANDLPVSGTKDDLIERLTEAGVEIA